MAPSVPQSCEQWYGKSDGHGEDRPIATADLRNGVLVVTTQLREKSLIEKLPGAKFAGDHEWRAPLSWATCVAMRGIFGDRLEIGPALEQWAWDEIDRRVHPTLAARRLAMDPTADCDGNPRLYAPQRTASEYLVCTGGMAILGDDMGTGKTVTSLDTIRRLDAFPLLIVSPNSMRGTWVREVRTWLDKDALLLEGSAPKRRKMLEEDHEVIVCGWSMLQRHSRLAKYGSIRLTAEDKTPKEFNGGRFKGVLADEAHYAKDPKSKWTRALWAIGDEAEHRLACTGSLFEKHEAELWALLRFVAPNEWPSSTRFIDRYCEKSFGLWGGLEIDGLNPRTEAEFRQLLDLRYIRRSKELIYPHLPPKVYTERSIALPPKMRKAYDQFCEGMVADVEGGRLAVFDPLVQAGRLSQFASATVEIVGEETDENGVVKPIVRLTEPSPKVDDMMDVLAEMGERPLVVFAASRQLLDLAAARLEKKGIDYARIVGGLAQSVRDDARDRYNNGEVRVLLISIGAGAEGLSLTRGDTAYFLNRHTRRILNDQAEDRLHGKNRGDADATRILIIDAIAEDTVEVGRIDNLAEKRERFQELVRDRDALLAALHGRENAA